MTFRRALHSRVLAWALAGSVALAYPLVVVAGGRPSFPAPGDCAHPATQDGNVMLVYGYFDSVTRAAGLRDRLQALGYVHAEVESDGGCGRVRVVVRGYPSLAGARDAVAEAERVGLHPAVEQAGS